MASLEIEAIGLNDKGLVRKNNEDNFYLNGQYMKREEMDQGAFFTSQCQDNTQIYAVCDGIGGTDAGEDASLRAVRELDSWQQGGIEVVHPLDTTPVLKDISRDIWRESEKKRRDSGTTLAMLVITGKWFFSANLGDSRVYLLRNGEFTRLSMDHSRVQQMIDMGMITPQEARTYPGRHVIDQYMGMPEDIKFSPYYSDKMELQPGDLFLLCSDGLTDMVEDQVIAGILTQAESLGQMGQELLRESYQGGGRDNITILLAKVNKAGRKKPAREKPFREKSAGVKLFKEKPAREKSVREKPVRDKSAKPSSHKALSIVLLVFQIVMGLILAVSVADYIYYLLH